VTEKLLECSRPICNKVKILMVCGVARDQQLIIILSDTRQDKWTMKKPDNFIGWLIQALQ